VGSWGLKQAPFGAAPKEGKEPKNAESEASFYKKK
jgi:hypothetical protein